MEDVPKEKRSKKQLTCDERRRNMKKLVSLTLVLSLMVLFCTNSFALSPTAQPIDGSDYGSGRSRQAPGGAVLTVGGGIRDATPEEMAYWEKMNPIIAKEKFADVDLKAVSTSKMAASWVQLSPFTYYAQNAYNTCGHACLRMAFAYKNGYAPAESTLVQTLGAPTNPADMANYFNNNSSSGRYMVKYSSTLSNMKANLLAGVQSGVAPIVTVLPSQNTGWKFDILENHGVTVYSVMSDSSWVALCDPWAGYVNNTTYRWYDMPIGTLHSSYRWQAGYMF